LFVVETLAAATPVNQVRHLDTMELAGAYDMEEELSAVNRKNESNKFPDT